MEDFHKTIGLIELLDEVTHDIDELRKKHPNDYGVKNMTIWWDLEKERMLNRHGSYAVIKRLRQIKSMKRSMSLFFGGWISWIALSSVIRLLIK